MGNVTVVVGLQWGDEGKGRVSHFVSNDAICVRSTGGNNARHTVVANEKKFTCENSCFGIDDGDHLELCGRGIG